MKRVSVIGCGKLGLCFCLALEDCGFDVLASDVIASVVDSVNNKTVKNTEPHVEELLVKSKNLRATTKLDEVIAWSDLIFIFVNTPTGIGEKSYDHGNLSNVLLQLAGLPVKGKNIVISCTVQPGYTGSVASYLMRDSGATLSYNPEFIAQGAIIQGLWYPDIILIGEGSKQAGDELCQVYEKMCKSKPVYHRMTPHEAEITKLSINCFITMKISFANMIGDIALQSNCNPDAILQAVGGDSRIGTKYLRPGYGYGGPCFPRDNRALATYARNVGVDAKLSVASDEFNKIHAEYQFQRFLKANLPLYEFKGVAYRDNCPVPLIEESQKLAVAKKLAEAGRRVKIIDNAAIIREVMKEFGPLFEYQVE